VWKVAWVRIDDKFSEHPKVAKVGPLGVAMQMAALCYANRNLTDGFIPKSEVPLLVNFDGIALSSSQAASPDCDEPVAVTWQYVVGVLVKAGLWEEAEGGYMIHDYLDYQPSRESVIRARKAGVERVREYRARRAQDLLPESGDAALLQEDYDDISETFRHPPLDQDLAVTRELAEEDTSGPSREQSMDEILARYSRYDEKQLDAIQDYWDVIRLTRKSGKVAGTVILRRMDYWERFPPEVVMEALRIHVRKYAGKTEDYTEGIMRRLQRELEEGCSYDGADWRAGGRNSRGRRRPDSKDEDSEYAQYDAAWKGP
jgi:hypothetical protein